MRIYGVPLTGSVFVEAASPAEAFDAAKSWSETVLRESLTNDAVPVPAGFGLVILKPQSHNIKDATDMVTEMVREAEVE